MIADIRSIRWERIWCEIVFREESDVPERLFLRNEKGEEAAVWQKMSGHTFRMNITNPGGGKCLPPGYYTLVPEYDAAADGEAGTVRRGRGLRRRLTARRARRHRIVAPAEQAQLLRNGSRQFPYGDGSRAYAALWETDKKGTLFLRVVDRRLKKASGKPVDLAKSVYRREMRRFLQEYYHERHRLAAKQPRKKVLFLTEQSDRLGSNLASLRLRCLERGLDREYEFTESCRISVTDQHLGFGSWMEVVRKMAEADIIFMDDHAPVLDWLRLSADTVVVQLWHAGVGFKASGYSRWGHLASPAPFSCHRQYTWGVCGSEKTRDIFAEIWGIDRERVLPLGMPRLDAQVDSGRREALRARFISRYFPVTGLNRKVILFAPTYRGKNRKDAGYPYEKIDFKALKEACGEEWMVVFKMHPWVKTPVPIPAGYREIMMDLSGQETIEALYPAADLLITDYSSDIYDFSVQKKPMLFYAFDEEEYGRKRGFHLDYRASAPGKVAATFEELTEAIRQEDFEEEKAEAYRERCFDYIDSHSCDRIIDAVLVK